jgi:hypothetical protein
MYSPKGDRREYSEVVKTTLRNANLVLGMLVVMVAFPLPVLAGPIRGITTSAGTTIDVSPKQMVTVLNFTQSIVGSGRAFLVVVKDNAV